jgi:hypothetical protein
LVHLAQQLQTKADLIGRYPSRTQFHLWLLAASSVCFFWGTVCLLIVVDSPASSWIYPDVFQAAVNSRFLWPANAAVNKAVAFGDREHSCDCIKLHVAHVLGPSLRFNAGMARPRSTQVASDLRFALCGFGLTLW